MGTAVMESADTSSRDRFSRDLQYALLDEDRTAVIRVAGRGNFLNSVPLKKFTERLCSTHRPERIVLDLGACETMDSTFMGVLASISLAQSRHGCQPLALCNVNDHIQKLLNTLGLARLMEINSGSISGTVNRAEGQLEPFENPQVSHTEQLSHTLEAHRILTRLDDGNVVRFQSVIHYLEKSLEEEKDKEKDKG